MSPDKYRMVRIARPVMHDKSNVVDVCYEVFVIDKKTEKTKVINEIHSMLYKELRTNNLIRKKMGRYMKKVVLMSLDTSILEWSPAKYQLLEELSIRGFETYLFIPGQLKNRRSYSSINHVINVKDMSKGISEKE